MDTSHQITMETSQHRSIGGTAADDGTEKDQNLIIGRIAYFVIHTK